MLFSMCEPVVVWSLAVRIPRWARAGSCAMCAHPALVPTAVKHFCETWFFGIQCAFRMACKRILPVCNSLSSLCAPFIHPRAANLFPLISTGFPFVSSLANRIILSASHDKARPICSVSLQTLISTSLQSKYSVPFQSGSSPCEPASMLFPPIFISQRLIVRSDQSAYLEILRPLGVMSGPRTI